MANGSGYGSDFELTDPGTSNQLGLSPDLAGVAASDRFYPEGGFQTRKSLYNPLAPSFGSSPSAMYMQASQKQPGSPTNFDLAGGDSISVMQYKNRLNPAMSNNRIWGVEGPQYNANNPAPFSPWETGAVGDSPNRIRDRYKYLLQQNPHYFDNINNMFLTTGSNDPSQLDAIKETLAMLKQANPNMHVVVPGMGPGVPDSAAMNKALQSAVEDAGYTFFQPQIRWAKDGVHPANSKDMFDQANTALNTARPSAQTASASPTPGGGMQSGLQPPTSPPINPLAPGLPQPTAAPTYNPYDLLKHFEAPGSAGLTRSMDEGSPSIGYGHTITKQELDQGYIAGPAGERIPLDRITPEQKEQIFQADMPRYMADIKKTLPEFDSLSTNQKEALFSYFYNTGHLPSGAAENIKAGNFKAVSDSIRAGPYTGVQSGYLPGLEARRNAEADQFMMPEGQSPNVPAIRTGGYGSGQAVGGSRAPSGKPYAVGTPMANVTTPPSQVGLGSPFAVPDNPFAPRPPGTPNTPAQDLAELNQRDRAMRAMQMWSMLSGILKGTKFTPVPVDYDPFKARGEQARVQSGPVVPMPTMQAPSFRAEQLPVHSAPILPMPVGTPGINIRRRLDSGV